MPSDLAGWYHHPRLNPATREAAVAAMCRTLVLAIEHWLITITPRDRGQR